MTTEPTRTAAGALLQRPRPDARARSKVGAFMDWLAAERGIAHDDYDALFRWSITDLDGFWGALWDYFSVDADEPPRAVLEDGKMPGAIWFPGARLNFAKHILDRRFPDDKPAVVARSQTRPDVELTFGELEELVARVRAGLVRLGVGPGDRVAAYLPNVPETLAAYLATASIGAIWSSCAPEFGARSVVDRFGQIAPKVLLAISGYTYREKHIDRRAQVAAIISRLPTVEAIVDVPYGPDPDALDRAGFDRAGPGEAARIVPWDDLVADREPLAFAAVPFDHPLCILFSSGTTGLPKAIVHGHGGILLEHYKNHALSWDLGPEDRMMWYSTTAWMIWNALVSSLLVGASIVMLDGDPMYPDAEQQWRLVESTGATVLGLSPAYVMACRKAGILPHRGRDLSPLREICSAGSPLPPEGAAWIVDHFGPDVLLNNGSGGTDVCSGIVQGNPLLPVWAGEISGRCLGTATAAFDEAGQPVVGELGELVITAPMPSMPVGLWGDDGTRYASTYFDQFPGIWRQGDWVRFTERGSCVITGRSDATLNRGGVRLGTSEFYRVVEELPEVENSLVVHLEDPDGGMGRLVLFVVLNGGSDLDDELRRRIAGSLRSALSPRHVPDDIVAMPEVPLSLTGKKLELPVKRLLQGSPVESVASRDALASPTALDAYAAYAAGS